VGLEDIDHTAFFTLSQSERHGHPYKLCKPNFKLDIRQFFFLFGLLMCVIR